MSRPIPQILQYLYLQLQGNRLQAILNTLVGVLLVVLDLAFVWATKFTIDIATHQTDAFSLSFALTLIAAIMVLRVALTISSRWIRATLGVRAQNSMRSHLFSHLLHCDWSSLKAFHTGNITNRIEQDVNDVVNFTTESIPSLITTTTQFLGAFFFLFFMDNTLAIIIVCVIPFFIISSKLYVRRMRQLTHTAREHESKIQSIIQETLQHVMVVKTLQRIDYFISSLSNQQENLRQCIIHRTHYSSLSAGLLSAGFATGYFVTFAWGTYSLSAGAITYGAMLAFIQLVGQIQGPIRNLSRFIPIFITSFTAAERLMEIEEIPIEDKRPSLSINEPLSISLRNVSFRYSSQSREIFKDFTYSFPIGSITAITGETGAGKTTLIRLLLSLIHPNKGQVVLISSSNTEFPMRAYLRSNISYVPQGNTLFSGTIRSNLLLGNPKATENEMKKALYAAAAEFVFRKPQGLDSPCGEVGDGLSEGQAQRISIARALLSNGKIFIFDEATSSLDEETERIVLQRITEFCKGRTLIFITHRPAIKKYATQELHI